MIKIPFNLLPASWGLRGEALELARAEYEISDPYTLALKKLEIGQKYRPEYKTFDADKVELDFSYGKLSQSDRELAHVEINFTGVDKEKAKLAIHLKHGITSHYDYDREIAKLDLTDKNLQIEFLNIDHKHAKITENDFKKQLATLREEPYISVVELGLDDLRAGYFELDWNDIFIQKLSDAGYKGRSDDELVNMWFNNLCRQVIVEEMSDQDFGLTSSQTDIVYMSEIDNKND